MLRLAAILAMLTAMDAHAATPREKLLRDLVETRNYMLGRPLKPWPTPDGKAVLFLRSPARSPEHSLYELDVATGKTREIVSAESLTRGRGETLTAEEKARRERMRVTVRGLISFEPSDDGNTILVPLAGRLYLHDRASGQSRALPDVGGAFDAHLSPDGKKVAYVRGRDLYVIDAATGKETRLTESKDANVSYGVAEFVAAEELSRFRGFWWSPDSTHIALTEVDNTGVDTLRIGDALKPDVPPTEFRYPRPGRKNARVRLGLVLATGGAIAWTSWPTKYEYLAQVSWKNGPLLAVVLTRDQKDIAVLALDDKAAARTLLAEHDDAWIDVDPTVPRWLPDGRGFLWSSDGDGHRRLELRAPDGKLVRKLGEGTGEYVSLAGVARAPGGVAFVLATDDPTRLRAYAIGANDDVALLAGPHGGVNDLVASVGDHGAVYVVTHTDLATPPRSYVYAHGHQVAELPSVAEEPPAKPNAEMVVVGARGFHAEIVRPHDFSPGKKYPVLVDVYGGPHHLQVEDRSAYVLTRQMRADEGYIVVALDGRGTPRRGREWSRAIKGDLARVPLEDQVAGLEALGAKYPEMDLARVGIVGWSYGGYMAALAVLARPDVYKVAVAGAPVVDWRDYDTAYTERYLGLPDADKVGYDASSLLTRADKLERPLLLIHGTDDDNVYFLHTLKLCDALFRHGQPFELLPLAGFTHLVPDPVVRERLEARIAAHLASVLHP